ncbi:extracellular solute-binding protein, partial [Candidatus Sumerlaeota bacterium]|nr:extracellular solute-binding protein [Candidatus Sumerlaeota bacterium]
MRMTRGIKHELQSFGTFGPASGGRMIRAAARCALALIAGASFFSCGGSEEGARSTGQKRILLYDTGIEEVNQRMWHTAIDRFEKAHPGVKVDFKPYKDDEYSQGGILIAALRSKTPPDVYFEWAWSGVERDAANGTSIDISPYLKPEFSEKFAPQAWAGAKYKEKPYLLPMTFEVANLIFYRKKALADHGIEPPKTWEEFLSVCKKLKGAGIQPIFQGNQAGWPA